jgi:pilus assembly protein Flp/PilA
MSSRFFERPCAFPSSPLEKEEIHAMKDAKKAFINFVKDESGQDLIEYALVAGLIGLGTVAAMTTLSTKIGNAFNSIGSQLANAV